MILGIYCFFSGYVTAEIKGRLNEKIINKCIRDGVFMWNVKSTDDGLRMNIRACDTEKLKNAVSGGRIVFSGKKGLPFIFERFKKRYALVFGILFFAAAVSFLSSLVWSINIKGCEKTKPGDVVKILRENGVEKWCFKSEIDEDSLKVRIMNGLDTVSWVGIDLRGTAVNIEIKERRETPYMVDDSAIDLVAAKDGVVSEMRVRNGEKMVKPGDTVIKGQLLVSALVERDGENVLEKPYTVHSYGDVIARTWYTFDIKQPLVTVDKEYTGEKYTRRRLEIAGFDINLYFGGRILYEEYDKIVKKRGKLVTLCEETFHEIKLKRSELKVSEAVELAVASAEKQLPEGILSAECLTREFTEEDGAVNAHIVFECTENIALEKPYTERRETVDDGKDSEN